MKQIILSACFLGIISAAAGMICPAEKTEKQLRLIIGALFIIIAAGGLINADLGGIYDALEVSESSAGVIAADAGSCYETAAERNLARSIEAILSEKGISAEIAADIDISENYGIYINGVTVRLGDMSLGKEAADIVRDAIGGSAAVYVVSAERAEENENG